MQRFDLAALVFALESLDPLDAWLLERLQEGRMSDHDVAQEEAVLARRRTRALVGDDRF